MQALTLLYEIEAANNFRLIFEFDAEDITDRNRYVMRCLFSYSRLECVDGEGG